MTSSLASRWTIFDRLIQAYRFRMVINLIPPGSIVADIGCGDGSFLRSIAHRISKGIGIDRKAPASDDKITYITVAENEAIPLPANSVDAVTALALVEHLDDPYAFVSEVYRILKKNGCLILTTPSPPAKHLLEFMAFRLGIISINDISDHKHYYTSAELTKLLVNFKTARVSTFQCGLNSLVFAVK